MYVEYLRAIRERGEQGREAWHFIEQGSGKGVAEQIETECNELARGYVHGWKRARMGLEANLRSLEAKLGS